MKQEEHSISMRDGVRLQTFLLAPDEDAPRPALLAPCTYGTDRAKDDAMRFVEAGYVVVLQNIRGRHASEGKLPAGDSTPEMA
jgi:hypothetical protein